MNLLFSRGRLNARIQAGLRPWRDPDAELLRAARVGRAQALLRFLRPRGRGLGKRVKREKNRAAGAPGKETGSSPPPVGGAAEEPAVRALRALAPVPIIGDEGEQRLDMLA